MENTVKIKCPAKINLTLEIVNRREDGFHNIKSIMQMISLYDYLDISIEQSKENKVVLSDKVKKVISFLADKALGIYLLEPTIKLYFRDVYMLEQYPRYAGKQPQGRIRRRCCLQAG